MSIDIPEFSEILLKPIVKGIQIYSKWMIPENSKPISTALNREDLRLLFENVDIGEELDLEEKIVISNLKIGNFKDTYIGEIQDQIIQIDVDNHYEQLHNNSSPYKYNYNYAWIYKK